MRAKQQARAAPCARALQGRKRIPHGKQAEKGIGRRRAGAFKHAASARSREPRTSTARQQGAGAGPPPPASSLCLAYRESVWAEGEGRPFKRATGPKGAKHEKWKHTATRTRPRTLPRHRQNRSRGVHRAARAPDRMAELLPRAAPYRDDRAGNSNDESCAMQTPMARAELVAMTKRSCLGAPEHGFARALNAIIRPGPVGDRLQSETALTRGLRPLPSINAIG